DAAEDRLAPRGVELPPLDRALGRGFDALPTARQELVGGLRHDHLDADPRDDLRDPGPHQAAAHDPDPHDVRGFHSGSHPSARGRSIEAMSRRPVPRGLVLSIAFFGVFVGHALTYVLLASNAAVRSAMLQATGHRYLPVTTHAGLALA